MITTMRTRLLSLVLLALAALPLSGQAPTETITIDAAAPAHPFPHFWEQMFGSGRAVLEPARFVSPRSARREADHRIPVRSLSRASCTTTSVSTTKTSTVTRSTTSPTSTRSTTVCWPVDVKPFVELSFMPYKLAARQDFNPSGIAQRCAAQGLRQVGRHDHAVHEAPGGALRHRRSGEVVLRSLERAQPRLLDGQAASRQPTSSSTTTPRATSRPSVRVCALADRRRRKRRGLPT